MTIMQVGINLAKQVFAIHAVDESGKAILVRPQISGKELLGVIAAFPPCVIGIEACSEVHSGRGSSSNLAMPSN